MNDGLQDEGKFFEIFQWAISDVDPSSWIPDISVDVGNGVYEQADEAGGFQQEEPKCPAADCI